MSPPNRRTRPGRRPSSRLHARSCAGLSLAIALAPGLPTGLLGQQTGEQDGSPRVVEEQPLRRPSLEVGELVDEIRLDGRLDEASWGRAPVATGFVQGSPVEGVPADEETEVRVVIGDRALYVGARMFESDVSNVVRQMVRRDDEGQYDYLSVSLDPNLDRRTGYYFRVNASNVQVDQYYYDDERLDRAWDAVWESAVHHDELGWTAEIRIPLSQIRYEATDDVQTWGVNFARKRMATNETSYYSLRSRTREGFVSQFGTLEEVRVPEPSRRIELRPYVLGGLHDGPAEAGDPFFDGSEVSARAGGEVRFGLGPAFTLDATINPDFGQVEADPAVINLSAFETRFSERRPFFVEDAQVFDFSLGSGGGGDELFYSRRIGRAPHGRPPFSSDFSDQPDDATILGAAKLTGRTQSGLSTGVLAAVTDDESGRAYFVDEDRYERYRVEPGAQFGVVTLQQDFADGASHLGGIVTAMRRDLPDDGDFDFLPSRAYTAGLGFEHQWNDRDWSLTGSFAASHVRGDSTAITRIQRSSNHYFQRPDATRYDVDRSATSMTGARWRLRLARQNGRHWTGSFWLGESTPGFEVNDLGFSRSSEQLEAGSSLSYREIQPGSVFRSYSATFYATAEWIHEALDDPGSWDAWESARSSATTNLRLRGTFLNEWDGSLNVTYAPDHYNFALTRGGPAMLDPGSFIVNGALNTDSRKAVYLRASLNRRWGFDDSGSELTLSGTVTFRPSNRLEISARPRVSRRTVMDQYVTSTSTLPYEPTFGRRYLFGELERRSVSMETRVDWAFSPSLSFQLFAQPLLSSGDYVAYKQLEAARTYAFDTFEPGAFSREGDVVSCSGGRMCTEVEWDGDVRQHIDFDGDGLADYSLADRDFNVRSLVGNAVLRWEYRPGATVFLVWQRRQSGRVGVGDFDLERDLDALLDLPADNRFMIKVNYWLGL